mgnify:CR=1 FL=1
MTDIRKFLTDVQKILKHDRQNNAGTFDYERVKNDIRRLFEKNAQRAQPLPSSIFEYWENEYIYASEKTNTTVLELSEERVNKLAAFLAFLNNSDELQEFINKKDWLELGRLVNFEAEELPVDILQDLMKILVSKGAY